MKLLAALVVLFINVAQGRRLQVEDTVPTYTPEECDTWLSGAGGVDTDGSGGLSSDEYFQVLSGLGLTTVATSYAELGFYDKMAFSTLACSCVSLGMGDDCCTGADAEIPLSVLTTVGDPAVDAYKTDLCNILASVIIEETTSPVAAPGGTMVAFDVPGIVNGFDAAEIQTNEGDNQVLSQVIKSFEVLTNGVLSTLVPLRKVRNLRASERKLPSLEPVVVTDTICPAELAYALEDSPCVNFKITVNTEDLSAEDSATYSEEMTSKINAGELYAALKSAYPETYVYGLGSPGAGGETIPVVVDKEPIPAPEPVVVEPAPAPAPEPSGLGTLPIVLIILAVIIIPIAIVAGYSQYSKSQEKERVERLRQYEGSRAVKAGDDDEFYDPDDYKRSKAGSSLAAMGAAGTAVAMGRSIPSDPSAIEEEVRILVEETKTPKTADELLNAYAGREAVLLHNLRKMKALQDKNASIRAEVSELCEKVNSPKSPDELLESYKGREEDLLKNLRKLSFKQQSAQEKKAMRSEIIALVEELELTRGPDEMMTTYEGREDVLLKNLKKMKAKREEEAANIAEIKVLVDELAVPKSADELLASYQGREGVLLANLKRMSTKKLKDEEIKAEIVTLVDELNAPKSADEMLASYQGREAVLLMNLRKLKSKKDLAAAEVAKKEATIAEITSLCDELTLPKTADEMLTSYEGREGELLKNLQKMKSRKDMSAAQAAQKEATIAEITSLCSELSLPKSADEMVATYEGKEDVLLKNLKKMKSKMAQKEATVADIRGLCDELTLPKTADEMLASYEGREGELLTNLHKMKSRQDMSAAQAAKKEATIAEITSLCGELSLPKSADEMLASYEDREDELLKNLQKMKSKQAKMAATAAKKESTIAEITSLCDELKPGRSTAELLAAYEGREEELLAHLNKLKKSKREA